MANPDAPYGGSPVMMGDGTAWNGKCSTYVIPSTDLSQYRIGDWVKLAANADADGVPACAKAAAADAVCGCIVAIDPVPPTPSLSGAGIDLSAMSIPGTKTKDYYVLVCDDPSVIFAMRGDTTGTNQVAANANKNCQITVTNPSPDRPYSATVIDSSTIAVTQAHVFKLRGLVRKPGNAFGASAEWYVKVNQHQLAFNTAGV